MIVYNRSAFGWRLIFRVHGSAVYRSVLPALIAVGFYFVFEYLYDNGRDDRKDLLHPYAVGVLVAGTTFLIVFKLNNSYGRYWEACGNVHQMISKWMDACTHTSVYHMQCDHYNHIKPPSFYDYPELNHLNMTRARERGINFDELNTWFSDDDDDDTHHDHHYDGLRSSVVSGLRNRKKKRRNSGPNISGHFTPSLPRPLRFTISRSFDGRHTSSGSIPDDSNGSVGGVLSDDEAQM